MEQGYGPAATGYTEEGLMKSLPLLVTTSCREFDKSLLLFLLIDFRKRERKDGGEQGEREREREIDLLFHLFMLSWVDSCMGPDC